MRAEIAVGFAQQGFESYEREGVYSAQKHAGTQAAFVLQDCVEVVQAGGIFQARVVGILGSLMGRSVVYRNQFMFLEINLRCGLSSMLTPADDGTAENQTIWRRARAWHQCGTLIHLQLRSGLFGAEPCGQPSLDRPAIPEWSIHDWGPT